MTATFGLIKFSVVLKLGVSDSELEDDASTDTMTATMVGIVAVFIAFSGDFDGTLVSSAPYVLDGTWIGTAPTVNGTGNGTWTAELQP